MRAAQTLGTLVLGLTLGLGIGACSSPEKPSSALFCNFTDNPDGTKTTEVRVQRVTYSAANEKAIESYNARHNGRIKVVPICERGECTYGDTLYAFKANFQDPSKCNLHETTEIANLSVP